MLRKIHCSLLLLAAGAGACVEDPANVLVGEGTAAVVADNGLYLNGLYLNGIYLNDAQNNGIYLNGIYLNGVYLNGVYLNGVYLNDTSLNGSVFTARVRGRRLEGAQLTGAIFNGLLSDGSTTQLRIDAVRELDPSDPDRDLFAHTVSARPAGAADWHPLCGLDAGGLPIEAIALQGAWNYEEGVAGGGSKIDDPSLVTFACRGAAIAKCVEIGYKPWKSIRPCHGCAELSLAEHHQACTRAIRADYCGNGQAHTHDGRPINLYDGIALQADTERWLLEAEWDADGARCVTPFRRDTDRLSCPEKQQRWYGCGAPWHFQSGTLLMSEITLR